MAIWNSKWLFFKCQIKVLHVFISSLCSLSLFFLLKKCSFSSFMLSNTGTHLCGNDSQHSHWLRSRPLSGRHSTIAKKTLLLTITIRNSKNDFFCAKLFSSIIHRAKKQKQDIFNYCNHITKGLLFFLKTHLSYLSPT